MLHIQTLPSILLHNIYYLLLQHVSATGQDMIHATKHRTHIHNRALLATQPNTACCHKTNWNSEINMTFNSVTLARTI